MSGTSRKHRAAKRKRRIANRLKRRAVRARQQPVLEAANIQYDVADRTRGINVGGIGVMHLLARRSGLIDLLDERVGLFKVHLPYHESDHILNIAYNILCGGTCLNDLEWLRRDEVYMDAMGARTIPDPTTAGDFCRRFDSADVEDLMDAINQARLRVWARQGESFFARAILDVDGSLVPTSGECKSGCDFAYTGDFGYHPLIVSLANTQEPLFLENRPGNRPSHEGAAARLDQAIALCREAGFRDVLLRGDTDFSQTAHLDRWNAQGVGFVFGYDATANLKQRANDLPESAWEKLERPKGQVQTQPRTKPQNVKEQVVVEREFRNIRLLGEEVAQFIYRPGKCKRAYRMVVVRKNLSIERGGRELFTDYRYHFFITNLEKETSAQVVTLAHQRCDQENLIGQLKHPVRSLRAPVDNLVSNWAYMVMASLAWSLKAWLALWEQPAGRWKVEHQQRQDNLLKMAFKQFCAAMIQLPCQIIRGGRRIVYRLLNWNDWQATLLRLADALRGRAAPA